MNDQQVEDRCGCRLQCRLDGLPHLSEELLLLVDSMTLARPFCPSFTAAAFCLFPRINPVPGSQFADQLQCFAAYVCKQTLLRQLHGSETGSTPKSRQGGPAWPTNLP